MFNIGMQGGMTPPIRPNEPQVIDPRAQYERQSILADQLSQLASQYAPNSGALGAIAMMVNSFAANKAGGRAEGALSRALEMENQREAEALKAQQQAEIERSKRELQNALTLSKAESQQRREDFKFEQGMQPDPSQVREEAFQDWQRREQWKLDNAPNQGGSLPPLVQAGMQRADQLLEANVITPEQHTNITNNLLNVDTADPNAPPEPSADERKREQARTDVANSLSNYRQLLERYGTEYAGDDAAALEAAYYDVILKVKTAEDLGVIAGPDMGLMEGVVGANPTGLMAQINPRGASRRLARIDQYMKNNNLAPSSDIVDPFAGGQ